MTPKFFRLIKNGKSMKLLFLSIFPLIFCCVSNTLFMDAKPIGENNQNLSIGASLRGKFATITDTTVFKNVDISFFPVDLATVMGITDAVDVFMKYTVPITLNIGMKSSFIPLNDRSHYYSAVGTSLGIDLVSVMIKDSTVENRPPLYFDVKIPVYQTISFNRYLDISVIPNIMIRVDYRYFQVLAGCNFNVKIGNTFGVFLEASFLHNYRYNEPERQFGLNAFFPLKLVSAGS